MRFQVSFFLVVAWLGLAPTANPLPVGGPPLFVNSLGMRFIPIEGMPVLFSIWETRVADFRSYAESEGVKWPEAPFAQTADHPAVNVSWEDAQHFCTWLTKREQKEGLLPQGWFYRLPTENEWMRANGPAPLFEDRPGLAVEDEVLEFPWGQEWPAPENAGNYHPSLKADAFKDTSPVGSFPANAYGLHDLGGNVWEWCADFYEGAQDLRVLKGGSFRMRELSDLLIASRVGNLSYLRLPAYGFRVVIQAE